jgi:tetratricopeptide (TPR) repeat protein
VLAAPGGGPGAQETATGAGRNGTIVAGETPADGEADRPFDESITVPELLDKAREAFGLGKYGLAEQYYQEILIRQRSNVQAMLELSNVYERSGRLEYARGLLARSAKLDPGNEAISTRLRTVERLLTTVLAEEVDSLMAAGQYETAIPKLSLLNSIEPENAEVLYRRAVCYSRLGRPDAALANVNAALQIDQKEAYVRLRSAVVEDMRVMEARGLVTEAKKLIQAGDPAGRRRALELLGEILQADPDHTWARAEFVRLSRLEETGGEAEDNGETDGDGGLRAVTGFLSDFVRRTGRLIQTHLSALLLLFAALVIFRSPLTRVISRAFKPRPLLSGRFPRFTLSEILIMLNSESHSGVLRVKGDSCWGRIWIEKGEPCHCAVGKLAGPNALYHLLANTGSGYFEFAEGSIPLDRTIDTPLSVVLIEHSNGGPGRPGRRRGGAGNAQKKPKSRMKELLDSKSGG